MMKFYITTDTAVFSAGFRACSFFPVRRSAVDKLTSPLERCRSYVHRTLVADVRRAAEAIADTVGITSWNEYDELSIDSAECARERTAIFGRPIKTRRHLSSGRKHSRVQTSTEIQIMCPPNRQQGCYQGNDFCKCSAVAEMGDRLATIDMGRKLDGLCPFLGGAGSPCNTMWPGPRPTSITTGILIHPAVWLQ